MQLRAKEVDQFALYTKQDDKHARVYAGQTFPEGAEIGSATSIFFSTRNELMAFLKSEARPNHRRFADRLIKLDDVMYEGMPKTFYGILVGIAGEVMSPAQGQRANVELVLAPAQGLNPGVVKLVVKTRNKVGVSKGAELLLDYGDDFDVTLPVLAASGGEVPMLGPMDRYMKQIAKIPREPETGALATTQGIDDAPLLQPEAKRARTEENVGGGEEMELQEDPDPTSAAPFADMEKFGEGDRSECASGNV